MSATRPLAVVTLSEAGHQSMIWQDAPDGVCERCLAATEAARMAGALVLCSTQRHARCGHKTRCNISGVLQRPGHILSQRPVHSTRLQERFRALGLGLRHTAGWAAYASTVQAAAVCWVAAAQQAKDQPEFCLRCMRSPQGKECGSW